MSCRFRAGAWLRRCRVEPHRAAPLAALVLRAASIGPVDFFRIATDERTLAALKLSFGTALVAAAINAVFGLLIAWILVRYRFPGRRIIDAAVDLPFALPTAVAGIAMAAIYAPNGIIGQIAGLAGIKIAYTPLGIIIAFTFIGLPFVVRTVQPILEEVEQDIEEGRSASRRQPAPHGVPGRAAACLSGIAHGLRLGLRARCG